MMAKAEARKEEWVSRVTSLLGVRDQAAIEIARILRGKLDELGEVQWLAICEKTWGWSRSTAYRHLSPEQLTRDREQKRNVSNSGHSSYVTSECIEVLPKECPAAPDEVVVQGFVSALNAVANSIRILGADKIISGVRGEMAKPSELLPRIDELIGFLQTLKQELEDGR